MAFKQNGSSSTCVIEPVELQDVSSFLSRPQEAKLAPSQPNLQISETAPTTTLGHRVGNSEDSDPIEGLPEPITHVAERAERWNQSRLNVCRTLAAFWSFVVMGSNDAAYGVCVVVVAPSFLGNCGFGIGLIACFRP